MWDDIHPMNMDMIRKAHAQCKSVLLTHGTHTQECAWIKDLSPMGGFCIARVEVKGNPLFITLDPNGRDTESGNFPFWEIW